MTPTEVAAERAAIFSSEAYVDRFCEGDANWERFRRSPASSFGNELHEESYRRQSSNTYEDRVRLLALTILARAKGRVEQDWAEGKYARFWCLLAGISHSAYARTFSTQGARVPMRRAA